MESIELDWMGFDDAAAFLTLPDMDVARLLLSGALRFRVVKRSPHRDFVLRMDVEVSGEDVREFQRERWTPHHGVRADELVNRAAMKHRVHPTRCSPGVRGRARERA